MSDNYSIETNATPEFVLAVLRDEHRHVVEIDSACDPEVDLTFDSTVADWRVANDLLPAKQLGSAINRSWENRFLTLNGATSFRHQVKGRYGT